MLGVVLAAGRGSRLGALTFDRSKPMMPVAGRPMIDYVLDQLAGGGVEDVIVVLHPQDAALIRHLERGPRSRRVTLAYQPRPLGTADALACASTLIRQREAARFVLASCDNLFPYGHVTNLVTCQRDGLRDAVLTTMWTPCAEATASALVLYEDLPAKGRIVDVIEKPGEDFSRLHSACEEVVCAPFLYALSTRVLDLLPHVKQSPRGEWELPSALRLLIREGGSIDAQYVECRKTLTSPEDLLALNAHVLDTDPGRSCVNACLPPDVVVIPPVRVDAEAQVASGSSLGPYVYLEGGCRVGHNVVVRRSILLRGASVGPNSLVEGAVVSGLVQASTNGKS